MDPITLAALSNRSSQTHALRGAAQALPKGHYSPIGNLSLNYKFFASENPRVLNVYIRKNAALKKKRGYEVRVGKQSVIRSKDGVRPPVHTLIFDGSCVEKIWQNWNAHRRLTHGEHFYYWSSINLKILAMRSRATTNTADFSMSSPRRPQDTRETH